MSFWNSRHSSWLYYIRYYLLWASKNKNYICWNQQKSCFRQTRNEPDIDEKLEFVITYNEKRKQKILNYLPQNEITKKLGVKKIHGSKTIYKFNSLSRNRKWDWA